VAAVTPAGSSALKRLFVDAGPLSLLAHPHADARVRDWLREASQRAIVVIPEIADYEVRRELIRANKTKSLRRLDELRSVLGFEPITSAAMLRAARFWADARNRGKPTADEKELDADVILAAQAVECGARTGAPVVVVTANVGHLDQFVQTERWPPDTG